MLDIKLICYDGMACDVLLFYFAFFLSPRGTIKYIVFYCIVYSMYCHILHLATVLLSPCLICYLCEVTVMLPNEYTITLE